MIRPKLTGVQCRSWMTTISLLVALVVYIGLATDAQQNGEVLVPGTSINHPYQIANNNRKRIMSHQHLVVADLARSPSASLLVYKRDTNDRDDDGGAKINNSVKIQYLDINGQPVLVQFTYVGPPKILPIATADSYPEGSTINLICTVSGGQRKGLTLSWMKDERELSDDTINYGNDQANISIEKKVDISILRINNATHENSGRFTCTAKNPFGEDSTSVNIAINVEMKWSRVPTDSEVGLNQDLTLECDAVGQPQPQVTWVKHPASSKAGRNETNSGKTQVVSQTKIFKISKAQHRDSGLYECLARNGVDEDLRRIVQIRVRGK